MRLLPEFCLKLLRTGAAVSTDNCPVRCPPKSVTSGSVDVGDQPMPSDPEVNQKPCRVTPGAGYVWWCVAMLNYTKTRAGKQIQPAGTVESGNGVGTAPVFIGHPWLHRAYPVALLYSHGLVPGLILFEDFLYNPASPGPVKNLKLERFFCGKNKIPGRTVELGKKSSARIQQCST